MARRPGAMGMGDAMWEGIVFVIVEGASRGWLLVMSVFVRELPCRQEEQTSVKVELGLVWISGDSARGRSGWTSDKLLQDVAGYKYSARVGFYFFFPL